MKTDLAEFYFITNLVDYAGQQTQRGVRTPWRESRTRKRRRCQRSGSRLCNDTAFLFWYTGSCLILSHAARERRL
jgi:hypothetical protein